MTTIITYSQMKQFYEDFKKNMPDDPFSRYYKEMLFTGNIVRYAKKHGLEKDVFEYTKLHDGAVQNLRNLGYKVEDNLDSNIIPGIRKEILEAPDRTAVNNSTPETAQEFGMDNEIDINDESYTDDDLKPDTDSGFDEQQEI